MDKQTASAFEMAVSVSDAAVLADALTAYAATTMGAEKSICARHAIELIRGIQSCSEGTQA